MPNTQNEIENGSIEPEYELFESDFDERQKLSCCNFRGKRGWYVAKHEIEDVNHVDLMCGHCVVEYLAGKGSPSDGKWTLLR